MGFASDCKCDLRLVVFERRASATLRCSDLLSALLDSNRRREKAELLTQPVNDVPFIRKMKLRLWAARGREQHKGRWVNRGLRHVKNSKRVFRSGSRARLFEVPFKKAIEL